MHNMCREKCFSKKKYKNGLNTGLSQQVRVEKIVHDIDSHWLSNKEDRLIDK